MMVVVASYQMEKLKHRLTSQNTDYSNLHRMLNGVKFAQNILDMTIKTCKRCHNGFRGCNIDVIRTVTKS